MIASIVTLCLLGIVAGAGLGIASKKFSVERDPRRDAVLDAMPGVNCGACGFAGCAGLADGIVAGNASPNKCTVASGEAIENIAKIMGVIVTIGSKLVARVICCGDKDNCPSEAAYQDIPDCRVMAGFSGGGKPCTYGCMGGGSCVDACAYDALTMGENRLPVVYEVKCIACG